MCFLILYSLHFIPTLTLSKVFHKQFAIFDHPPTEKDFMGLKKTKHFGPDPCSFISEQSFCVFQLNARKNCAKLN